MPCEFVSSETFTRYHDGRYYRPYKKSANCIRGCVHSQAGGGGVYVVYIVRLGGGGYMLCT